MKCLTIAWKDFMIRFKDRRGFMLMILMPLILTFILGSALGGVMGEDATVFPKTNLGIVWKDDDPLARQFIRDVLQSRDLKPYIHIKMADSREALEEHIREGSIDAAIVFPNGWSRDLNNGKLKGLTILADPGKSLQSDILQTLSQTFMDRAETTAVSTKTVLSVAVDSGPEQMAGLSQEVADELKQAAQQQWHAVEEKSVGQKPVSGMQYYAAAMAAMFLLFNMMNGAKSFIHERETQTLARLFSTPTEKISILIGKFLGTLYFAVAQFLIFMLATRFLFGVNWGDNALQTLSVGAAFAIAVSGLSMLIASVIHTEKTADVVGGIGVQILALLGGSMVPLTLFPDMLRQIAHIAPNTWALTSLVDIMGGTAWSALALPIGVLAGIGAAAVTIGTWRLQAR